MTEPLALKYRPKTFTDLVGQKASRAVLAKMITQGRLPPCMIFAGVRGTGKTSVARIVAKAINCSGERDRGFEPCGVCDNCAAVDHETAGFYVEVDAASHGGADAMRELMGDALYTAGGDWKVYVLDEVHSVSTQGFQVMLKTLEEPPPRTSFILVTTEPERIPETIHARSMFFRFSKITGQDIRRRVSEVAQLEGIAVTGDAVDEIVERANGGMRDALMTLDQLSRLEREITLDLVLGLFGEQSTGKWLEALLSGNPAKAVLVADEMVAQHGSVQAMIDRALITLRGLLLWKAGVAEAPPRDVAQLRLGQAEVVEMIRKLWLMRVQVRQVGPEDRAAITALSAEMARKPVVEPEKGRGLSVAEIEERIGS